MKKDRLQNLPKKELLSMLYQCGRELRQANERSKELALRLQDAQEDLRRNEEFTPVV